MHYGSGNYQAFARPRKPAGADDKRVWLVGAGLANLTAAIFMIRDGQIAGDRITFLEELDLPGGALDGIKYPEKGFVIRGGRELEEHMECLWDAVRTVPSLEIEGASMLDEFVWLNNDDPNYSKRRVTEKQGKDAGTDFKFNLSKKAQKEVVHLFMSTRAQMENKRIDEVFSREFLDSNFWLYWRTMFAFEEWHSALEMKLYFHRFSHLLGEFPDMSALKFTKYNQYESFVLPIYTWLLDQGVTFQFSTTVTDVQFDITPDRKRATRIDWVSNGVEGGVDLTVDDLVLITIGSLTENSDDGSHHKAAQLKTGPAPAWDLWKTIAAKSPEFGRPEVFCGDIEKTKWESATATTLDERVPKYIEAICERDPFSGKVVTGGIVTVRDSPWLMSWTVNRQPHFKAQKPTEIVAWIYGLFVDVPGSYVKKPMQECTGEEITQEWLYHMGVPVDEIPELAANAVKTVPVMMPYVTSFFMPRQAGDRPQVVPAGSENFAFVGQFAETTRDTIFTTEYSVRTGMVATYELLDVERAVPEVFNSTYDLRYLLKATTDLQDGAPSFGARGTPIQRHLINKLANTELGHLLADFGVVPGTSSLIPEPRTDDAKPY
ncbi:MAG: oleate hydratase [Microbacterium sp.]|uniref:oleate hydratase n=1 Tax=Microbacterium sp. TaxID=51671 RepID=UPI003A8934FF